jgi:hypothetical protein
MYREEENIMPIIQPLSLELDYTNLNSIYESLVQWATSDYQNRGENPALPNIADVITVVKEATLVRMKFFFVDADLDTDKRWANSFLLDKGYRNFGITVTLVNGASVVQAIFKPRKVL